MFIRQYGEVTLAVKSEVPKRGEVLCLSKPAEDDGVEIYMDFCGSSLPDGTNAYMFGNRLFVVTLWADMTDDEQKTAITGNINLVFDPLRFLQGAMRVGEYGWSDITFTLYHCMRFLNDETQPVSSIVFLFCDQLSGEIVAEREVALSPPLGEFLRQAFELSHKSAALDMNYGGYLREAQASETHDFCDILYNTLAELSQEDVRVFRDGDINAVPYGVYVTVDSDNRITNLRQNGGK